MAVAVPKSREEYRDVYLKSAHWSSVRTAALAYADHRCQVCYGRTQLDVHHRTYERLGREKPSDVTVLCRHCHETHHRAMARGPRSERSPDPNPASKNGRRRQRRRERQREVAPGALRKSLAEMKERNAA